MSVTTFLLTVLMTSDSLHIDHSNNKDIILLIIVSIIGLLIRDFR